jgi:hypothetical protein
MMVVLTVITARPRAVTVGDSQGSVCSVVLKRAGSGVSISIMTCYPVRLARIVTRHNSDQ